MTSHRPALTLSPVVAGMMRLSRWNLSPQQRHAFIRRCLEMGITSFDHADIYGGFSCEALFGEALRIEPSLRDKMELVSKCNIVPKQENNPARRIGHYNSTFDHIVSSAERSLKNLQTDYLDLLLIHRADPLMDAAEVARAFEHLRATGKVRHFGVSNFDISKMQLLQSRLTMPLQTNQIELSLLHWEALENGMSDYLQQRNIAPMIWSPLAGGRLFSESKPQLVTVLRELSQKYESSPAALAFAWIARVPFGARIITGSGKIERLREAIDGISINLSRHDWFWLYRAARGYDVP